MFIVEYVLGVSLRHDRRGVALSGLRYVLIPRSFRRQVTVEET